jgi:hypothetical protein
VLRDADALADIPVSCLYQALDRAYPGSKFVLTVREEQAWLRSCKNFWQQRIEPAARLVPDAPKVQYMRAMIKHLYGTFTYEEESFSGAYNRYTAEVRAYFQHRPEDVLFLDICSGQGWKELAPFLGVAIPDVPYPQVNQGVR